MTIKKSFVLNYDQTDLTFGVPLEDLSSNQDIHPYILYLFHETYRTVVKSNHSIEYILDNMQGTVNERLNLKELIEKCVYLQFKKLPGALLWIIRHFIGLLPLPLMPHYTNNKFFNWKKLSLMCKQYLTSKEENFQEECKLNIIIIQNLAQLQTTNFLFIQHLFNFLRKLIVLPFDEPRFHRYSLLLLSRYYCSALFLRPYNPRYIKDRDKHYFHLLYYLIMKWSDLKRIFHKNCTNIGDRCTQTLETITEDDDGSTGNEQDCLEECIQLREKQYCYKYDGSFDVNNEYDLRQEVYGWVEETKAASDRSASDILSNYYNGWIFQTDVEDVKTKMSTPSYPSDSGEYIYDELYETIYEDAQSVIQPNEEVSISNVIPLALNDSEPIECNTKHVDGNIETLLSPINLLSPKSGESCDYTFLTAKSSQHYSNNCVNEITEKKSTSSIKSSIVKRKDISTNKDYYKITHGIIDDTPRSNDYDRINFVCNSSNLSLSSSNKNKINLEKFRKIASRFDIFNLFKKKPRKVSSIHDNLDSKIKYKKMKSTYSNLF